MQELESYGGDPGNLVVSGTFNRYCHSSPHLPFPLLGSFSRAPGSDSSGSTAGDESEDEAHHYVGSRDATRHLQDNGEPASEDEETEDDEARELPNLRNPAYYDNRPQSAQSSNRYRTPLGGSLLISPTPDLHRVPSTQPQPNFETPSAFAAPLPAGYPNPYPSHYSDTPRRATSSPHDSRHTASVYRGQYGHDRPPSRPTLEHAIENVQAHLAALTERIESLETRVLSRTHSPRGGNSPRWLANRGAQPGDPDEPHWDINDLGLWSVVLNPLSKGVDQLKEWAVLFSRDETRSPAKAIIRRLVLDISFLLCVLAVVRAVWRRSGVRRREVKAALVILWRALIGAGGSRQGRSMSDKAV